MSSLLLFVQHSSGTPLKTSLCALSAAQELQRSLGLAAINTVTLGEGAELAAKGLLGYGVSKALHCAEPSLSKYLPAPYSAAILAAQKATGASVLVAAASSSGKDVMPRVASALGAGQASDIVAVLQGGQMRRPMYAGDVFADVEVVTSTKVVTVRASAFQPAPAATASGTTEAFSLGAVDALGEVIGYEMTKAERPQLSDAETVVSGGRALQSADNFMKYMAPLADAFGAAIGASRAAVDSGYAPNDWQVGQTGKIVAPKLYVAVGISGAIQHLAGMKDSKVIVAINKDAEAPIFEVADYGLVADLFSAVPALTEAISKARKG